MFTGIIEEVGEVRELRLDAGGARIVISCRKVSRGIDTGDSVAVNGVCLTAVDIGEGAFAADVSRESLQRSTLGGMKRGRAVNLERALTLSSRLGGHIVQGHVDGVGTVGAVRKAGGGRVYVFAAPGQVKDYLVEKGSVAVDGISLTVSSLTKEGFSVAAIPLTVEETNLKGIKPGDAVNLEADIIAKYVRRYVERGLPGAGEAPGVDGSLRDKLAEGGFM